jgi:hypothetical protein
VSAFSPSGRAILEQLCVLQFYSPSSSSTVSVDPSKFSVPSVTVPDSVRPDESIEISVTARNHGSVPGYFLATFDEETQYTPHPLSIRLDAGEERTKRLSLPNRADSGVDQAVLSHGVRLVVGVGGGAIERRSIHRYLWLSLLPGGYDGREDSTTLRVDRWRQPVHQKQCSQR